MTGIMAIAERLSPTLLQPEYTGEGECDENSTDRNAAGYRHAGRHVVHLFGIGSELKRIDRQ